MSSAIKEKKAVYKKIKQTKAELEIVIEEEKKKLENISGLSLEEAKNHLIDLAEKDNQEEKSSESEGM